MATLLLHPTQKKTIPQPNPKCHLSLNKFHLFVGKWFVLSSWIVHFHPQFLFRQEAQTLIITKENGLLTKFLDLSVKTQAEFWSEF